MFYDNQTEKFELKLSKIEKNIQEENDRANTNRMKARFFMFYILIGADEQTREVLERKVRDLLRNPDACEFIHINGEELPESYDEIMETAIHKASNKHVDVQNLNNLFLCPVVFANNSSNIDFVSALKSIDNFVAVLGKMPVWQPFIVIDRSVSQYENISKAVSDMERFICSNDGGYINRCCILSDKDSDGFSIPQENIMQTIAMTVVLQNVVSDGSVACQPINSVAQILSNSSEKNDLFFTARNAAVTNPVRSITMQRIKSAINYFSGKTDKTSQDTLSKIDFSFINNILYPALSQLPQIADGFVTYFPLYAVMNGPDLQQRLQEAIDKYYAEPLSGGGSKEEQIANAKKEFLVRFFALNGSLSELKEMIDDNDLSQKMILNSKGKLKGINTSERLPDKIKNKEFLSGMYLNARNYCEKIILEAGTGLIDELGKSLCDNSTKRVIEEIENAFKLVDEVVEDRLRTLRDVETVLAIDSTIQSDSFDSIHNEWMIKTATQNQKAFYEYNKNFDDLVHAMVQHKNTDDITDMLDVCYEAVKGRGYTNTEYLSRLSEECQKNEERAIEFTKEIEKNWCYTLRFLKYDENRDSACIIGDPGNRFCTVLKERFGASLYEFKDFDRIDVLRISSPFSPDNIWEWSQIEQRRQA